MALLKRPKCEQNKIILLFLLPFIFLATLKTHRTYSGDGDEPHYLLIAESLYDDRDLRMENQYPDKHLFIPQPSLVGHTIQIAKGSLYPIHDIGLPVLMLPLLSVLHAVISRIPSSFLSFIKMDPSTLTCTAFAYQSMVATGLLTILYFFLLQQHGFSQEKAFYFSLLAMLTAPMATHGYLFFTEIYSATFIVAMILCLRAREFTPSVYIYFVSIFFLCWLHIKNLALAGVMAILWICKKRDPTISRASIPVLFLPTIGLGMAIGFRAVLHWYYFGRPSLTAAWGGSPLGLASIPHSILGLALDRSYGLLFANPIFWLLPVAVWYNIRLKREWVRTEGVAAFVYIVGILLFPCWWAGWSPAARHLVPVIPLLWIPLAKLFDDLWSGDKIGRLTSKSLVAVSIFLSFLLWQEPRLFWFSEDGLNRWMDLLSVGGVHWQRLLPSFFANTASCEMLVLGWGIFFVSLNILFYRKLVNKWH